MNLADYEGKIYSQFGEDLILVELVRRINPTKNFLEIGAGHNGENCTRILLDYGWQGTWIEGNPHHADHLMQYLLTTNYYSKVFIEPDFITVESIPERLWPTNVGVLSIDVDGTDYWIWKALCPDILNPAIVIIEAQIQKPLDEPYIMPYDPNYIWDHKSYDCGASLYSMVELGKELGYHFVGKCPDPHSPNIFFVREEFKALLG